MGKYYAQNGNFASRCVGSGVVFPTELSTEYFQLLISEKLRQKKENRRRTKCFAEKHFVFLLRVCLWFLGSDSDKQPSFIACFLSLLRQTCAPGICGTIRLPIDTFQFSQLSEGLDINNNNRTVYLFFIDLPVLLERLRPTGQRFCLCMVKILKKNPLRKKKEAVKHFSFRSCTSIMSE